VLAKKKLNGDRKSYKHDLMTYGIIFNTKSQGDIVTINGLFRNDGANPAFLVVLDPAAAIYKLLDCD